VEKKALYFVRQPVDEGTKFGHYELEILKDNLIANLIYLAIGRAVKSDLHTVRSKI
jgi:hypothetical protein